MTSIIARVSEQSLNVTSATPEITTKQQQASNNSLLVSLLNDIIIKPFKHVVFYLAGLAEAGLFILFIACVNVNTWCECCAAIRGRWLDLCFKREWQSLAGFYGATVARGVLMMINLRQMFIGWLCFTAGRREHRVGTGGRRRPLHRFLSEGRGRCVWGGGNRGGKMFLRQSV